MQRVADLTPMKTFRVCGASIIAANCSLLVFNDSALMPVLHTRKVTKSRSFFSACYNCHGILEQEGLLTVLEAISFQCIFPPHDIDSIALLKCCRSQSEEGLHGQRY